MYHPLRHILVVRFFLETDIKVKFGCNSSQMYDSEEPMECETTRFVEPICDEEPMDIDVAMDEEQMDF